MDSGGGMITLKMKMTEDKTSLKGVGHTQTEEQRKGSPYTGDCTKLI